jgi:hypothetical protein
MAAPKSSKAAPKPSKAGALEINRIETTTAHFAILGKRPVLLNRLSEKTKRELLAPAGRKTTAQKQSSLKHDPFQEFRAAPYTLKEANAPTFLAVMSSAFKNAMGTAALDLPGARKSQIGRLVWVEDDLTPLYGIPTLHMGPVRSSDINRTPDMRTRVCVKDWACRVRVTFVHTLIKPQAIVNLLMAAGLTAGIGDWRNEKGKGIWGQFELTMETDERYIQILENGGRAAQLAAMDPPECFDEETEELLQWWLTYVKRRGFEPGEEDEDEAEEEAEAVTTTTNGVGYE